MEDGALCGSADVHGHPYLQDKTPAICISLFRPVKHTMDLLSLQHIAATQDVGIPGVDCGRLRDNIQHSNTCRLHVHRLRTH